MTSDDPEKRKMCAVMDCPRPPKDCKNVIQEKDVCCPTCGDTETDGKKTFVGNKYMPIRPLNVTEYWILYLVSLSFNK